MELLLHFLLSLNNNIVSSQIIYSTSRYVPFPFWLICPGCYRYFNESWPCGWHILEEFTKDLCYNLYYATKIGDFGANLLFLCHPFSVSSVLQGLCSIRGLPERTDIQEISAPRNSTVQILCTVESWPSLGKPTWPSVLLSCRVTGEVIFCCMGLQINRHDKRDENENMVSRICRELLFQSAKAKCVQVHDS